MPSVILKCEMLKRRRLYHDVLFCIANPLSLHRLMTIIDNGFYCHFLQCRLKSFAHMQGLKWSMIGLRGYNGLDYNSCAMRCVE